MVSCTFLQMILAGAGMGAREKMVTNAPVITGRNTAGADDEQT